VKSFSKIKIRASYLLYGAGLHLLFLWALNSNQPTALVKLKELPKTKRLMSPVAIEIQKKKKKTFDSEEVALSSLPSPEKEKPPGVAKPSLEKDANTDTANSAVTPRSPAQSYSSLLPAPSELSAPAMDSPASSGEGISSSNHSWLPSLNIGEKRALIRRGSNLRAMIEIPLSARSVTELGKATARIARPPDSQGLLLVELVGKPLIRAVLFKSLSSLPTKEALHEIFNILNTREVTVVLHLIAGDHRTANEDSYKWRENRVDIYLTKGRHGFSPSGLHWNGGLSVSFTLPDEKADRAREVDEAEFAELEKSPAYISQLTNRPL
jgi:hypothetical protein